MKKRKSDHCAANIIFIIGLTIYAIMMYKLVYEQGLHSEVPGIYPSDIKAYIHIILGLGWEYDCPYPIYFGLGKFFLLFMNVEAAAALAAVLLNSLGVVALFYYVRKLVREYVTGTTAEKYGDIFAVFLSFSIFGVSMLYLPGNTFKYLGSFSPNPYHNVTYIATRPFAVLTFFLYVQILEYYEERTDVKEFFLFGLSLLLTTLAKPSYTLVFVSAAGLLMVYRLFRKRWKNFKKSFYLGLAFVPTFIALLYQFGSVFGHRSSAGGESSIGFGIAMVWKGFTENIPLSIILAQGFPLLTLIFHLKEIKKHTLYRFSWIQMAVSMGEFLLLYEKGPRFAHANFSWGYMHGLFFIFAASLLVLAEDTIKKRGKKWALYLQWIVFGTHLLCGAVYFLYVWRGNPYH